MTRNARNIADMTWWEYVRSVVGDEKQGSIADKVGVTHPTVGRWKTGNPDAATAVRFARAYGRPALEALVAAGFISPDEAGQPPAAPIDYTQLTNRDLVDLIEDRLLGKEQSDGRKPEAEKSTQPGELIPFRDPKAEGRPYAARMDDEPEDEG